jgi:hypothetical protein
MDKRILAQPRRRGPMAISGVLTVPRIAVPIARGNNAERGSGITVTLLSTTSP